MADPTTPRTRRSLLAAAGAGAAGLAAASLGTPVRTLAANGDPVIAGSTTFATAPTTVAINSGSFIAVSAQNNDADATSVSALYAEVAGNHSNAVEGYAAHATGDSVGVRGGSSSPNGTGVWGTGGSRGVLAQTYTDNGRGLLAVANVTGGIGVDSYVNAGSQSITFGVKSEVANDGGIAVVGIATNGSTGILGFTGDTWPLFPTQTGVMGYSAASASSIGVYGLSVDGTGVLGTATGTGTGVWGQADSGTAVHGTSASGVGVLGESSTLAGVRGQSASGPGLAGQSDTNAGARGTSNSGVGVEGLSASGTGVHAETISGRALQAVGRVAFSSAGRGTIAKGARSKTVASPVALTSASKVLVTLMGNPGGTTAVQRVAISVTNKTITVYLTAVAAANTPFAFFVID